MPASLTIGKDWISWARNNIDSILIVFDLDGTLVDEDRHIKHSDCEIITEVHRRGAKITVATGRTYNSARPFISQLEIEIPVILCNGAVILDPRQNTVLYERKIPPEIAMVVLIKSVQHKLEPIIYTDGVHGFPCVNALTPSVKDFLLLDGVYQAELNVLEEIVQTDPPAKIQVIGNPGTLCSLQQVILAEDPAFPIVMSQDDYLEIMPPGVSKGQALFELCRMINIPLAHTLAFGDGRNDEEMLVAAGLGVAMSNGPEKLKRKADLSTSSISSVLNLLI